MSLPQTTAVRYRGDSSSIGLSLIDPDTCTAFDPTGNVLLFSVKEDAQFPDSSALIQKISTVGGITIVDAPSGSVTVALVPSDFANITPGIAYEFDVQAQNAGTGAVKTVARGQIVFPNDVTKNVTLSIPTTTTNPTAGFTWAGLPDKPAFTGAPAAATNNTGDTTFTFAAGQLVLKGTVTFTGTASTRHVILSETNAAPGIVALLNLIFPAVAGIVVELRAGTAGGTLLASVTSDGIAGTVGIITAHGPTAWDAPTQAAWLD